PDQLVPRPELRGELPGDDADVHHVAGRPEPHPPARVPAEKDPGPAHDLAHTQHALHRVVRVVIRHAHYPVHCPGPQDLRDAQPVAEQAHDRRIALRRIGFTLLAEQHEASPVICIADRYGDQCTMDAVRVSTLMDEPAPESRRGLDPLDLRLGQTTSPGSAAPGTPSRTAAPGSR